MHDSACVYCSYPADFLPFSVEFSFLFGFVAESSKTSCLPAIVHLHPVLKCSSVRQWRGRGRDGGSEGGRRESKGGGEGETKGEREGGRGEMGKGGRVG